jgi:plastocyanin
VIHVFAEIGSDRIVAAVVLGVPVAVAVLFLLWAVPKRVGPLQPLGSLVVVGLLGLGLWAAFGSSPPAATSSTALPAGGVQFSPVGPSSSAAPSGKPPASASPGPSGSPGAPSPQCKPSGTALTVTASVSASTKGFDQTCLAAPAGQDFTVTLKNDDTGTQHDWALFRDPSASDRLGGAPSAADFTTGPGEATYQVKGLPSGTYFFHCDFHPTTMKGTFVVP